MNLRIILFLLIASLDPLLANDEIDKQTLIFGKTAFIDTCTMTTEQFVNSLAKRKEIKEGQAKRAMQRTLFRSKKPPRAMKNRGDRSSKACPPSPTIPTDIVPMPQNPDALPGAFYPDPAVSNFLVPAPQKIGVTFVAGDPKLNPNLYGTPPDTNFAVGKSQVVLGDNNGIVAFDRQGNRQGIADVPGESLFDLDGSFTLFVASSDVRIRYDEFSERFFVITLNADNTSPLTHSNNGVSLAISSGNVINRSTTWTVLNIWNLGVIPDLQGCPGDLGLFYDFPSMAIDKHAVYITEDLLDSTGFVSSSLFVVQKASLLKGKSAVITAFRDIIGIHNTVPFSNGQFLDPNQTVQPAMNFDSDQKYGYLVAGDPAMYGRLIFSRVVNPGSKSPSLTPFVPINVLKTAAPALRSDFPENLFGDIGLISQNLDRLQMAHVINQQLFTAHAISTDANGIGDPNGDRVSSRWYQFDLTGDKSGRSKKKENCHTVPVLVQAGTLFDARDTTDPLSYIFPAIMTNKRGDLTLCGTVSSKAQPFGAFFVGRLPADLPGTLRIGSNPPSVYAIGSGPFTQTLGSANDNQRWGDMTYTVLDPEDHMTMWTMQEIAIDGQEITVVGQLLAPENE